MNINDYNRELNSRLLANDRTVGIYKAQRIQRQLTSMRNAVAEIDPASDDPYETEEWLEEDCRELVRKLDDAIECRPLADAQRAQLFSDALTAVTEFIAKAYGAIINRIHTPITAEALLPSLDKALATVAPLTHE